MSQFVVFMFTSLTAIGGYALRPAFPTAILAALLYTPTSVLEQLSRNWLVQIVGLDRLRYVLCAFILVGGLRSINRTLNAWATNNWNWRASPAGDWQWDKEVAVVTGGCGGIGMALVQGLCQKGVRVAIFDIQEPPKDLDPKVKYIKCDLTSPKSVAKAAGIVRTSLGTPSILIQNAGLQYSHPILELPLDDLHKIFGVNIMSLWYTTKEFLPAMVQKNKGHIVTVTSGASFTALPTSVDYSATKVGALAFHEGLTSELKHIYHAPGVLTTVVHPGFVLTKMTEHMAKDIAGSLGKMLVPEDIAAPVLKQIFNRRGAQLIIPAALSVASGLRGWPNWAQEIVRDRFGKADRTPMASH